MSIFYDGQPGPEVREQLNALYDAFAGSAYPPTAGMFAPGTLSAPSVRGTADPTTGWNLLNGEAQLSVGGALKARATAAGFLDALGNPWLSAANAAGQLASGAIIQYGENSNGSYVRFAGGLIVCMRYTPHVTLSEPVPKGGFIPKTRREFPHLFNGQPLFVQSMLQGSDITNTHAAAAQGREFDGYASWETDFLVLSDVPVSRYALFDIAVGVWK